MRTKNNENPYDLGTSYGIYAAITVVLKHYSDRTRLQRTVEKPVDPKTYAAQLDDTSINGLRKSKLWLLTGLHLNLHQHQKSRRRILNNQKSCSIMLTTNQ
jgi:hypothetical protein